MSRIVIALGGNALEEKGLPPTAESQLAVARRTTAYIADIIQDGHEVIISHGNGPQIGRILLASENSDALTPALPFDVCGAMSQGYIGYHLQQALQTELARRGLKKPVVTLVTQVLVDAGDAAFKNPTKPIGPFYAEAEARKIGAEKNYVMKEDAGRGWRRVVASPRPVGIVELAPIKTLLASGCVVVACGGGGVPVVRQGADSASVGPQSAGGANGAAAGQPSADVLIGVAAVIDKDFASEKLAEELDADQLMILTEVSRVSLNFNKPDQRELTDCKADEIAQYAEEGHFAPGSMLPKVTAAIQFARSKAGRCALISSLDCARPALAGEAGTRIVG